MGLGSSTKIDKVRTGGRREVREDLIPREVLLYIFLDGHKVSVISCSPHYLMELAAGYAVSNGYVSDYKKINIMELCTGEGGRSTVRGTSIEIINVKIRTGEKKTAGWSPAYIQPGCGSIDGNGMVSWPEPLLPGPKIQSDIILELNRKNLSVQEYKKALGGLHSVSLFDIKGGLILVREDIGRHNCLDKVIGNMLINEIDASDKLVFTSGRISLDLVFKAARSSIPVVITNSSVTHGAVTAAKKLGLSVIGYARGNRFNIYSHPERII